MEVRVFAEMAETVHQLAEEQAAKQLQVLKYRIQAACCAVAGSLSAQLSACLNYALSTRAALPGLIFCRLG